MNQAIAIRELSCIISRCSLEIVTLFNRLLIFHFCRNHYVSFGVDDTINLSVAFFENLSLLTVAAFMPFILSDLLHVHLVLVAFNDTRYILPTFSFFLLHGIACALEVHLPIRLPSYLGWFVTHLFLLVTAPLAIEPYIKSQEFFICHVPPLFNNRWISRLSRKK